MSTSGFDGVSTTEIVAMESNSGINIQAHNGGISMTASGGIWMNNLHVIDPNGSSHGGYQVFYDVPNEFSSIRTELSSIDNALNGIYALIDDLQRQINNLD